MTIDVTLLRRPEHGNPLVMACFSYRYDAALVPDLIANITPVVHGWLALDDRKAESWYSSEPERRRALLERARRLGTEWLLVVDPDERLEPAWAQKIRMMTTSAEMPTWSFNLLEMYDPTHARVDGLWSGRTRIRLFPLTPDIHVPDQALHAQAFAYERPRITRSMDLSIYHLRMATAARRRYRRDQYALLDPAREMQKIGYDYLDMDEGLVLKTIPPARMYQPLHVEDGQLWAEIPRQDQPIPIDPLENRLELIQRTATRHGVRAALPYARRTRQDYPDSPEMLLLAARLEHEAGDAAAAERLLSEGEMRWPLMAAIPLLRARALLELGRDEGARAAASRAVDLVPGSLITTKTLADTQRGPAAFAAEDALWRRWVREGGASCREGRAVARDAPITVIVIGFRGQPETVEAIDILLAETTRAELVVVNSGGGDLAQLLGPRLEHLRLIELEAPHFVGTARNIGIDASTAPIVSFLAGDCLPLSGSIEARLAAHARGEVAVPSTIVPAYPGSLVSWVGCASLRHSRMPGTQAMQPPGYGLSYQRRVFDQIGYFPTGLLGGEDTFVNTLLYKTVGFSLHSSVCTAHRDPLTVVELWKDARKRARLRVMWSPDWRVPQTEDQLRRRVDRDWTNALKRPRQKLHEMLGRRADDEAVHRLLAVAARARSKGTKQGLALIAEVSGLAAKAEALVQSDPAAAQALLETCIALDPYHVPHIVALARLHAARGQDEACISVAQRGAALDPANINLAALMSDALCRLGREKEALTALEKGALLAPRSVGHWRLALDLAARLEQTTSQVLYKHMAFLANPTEAY